MTSMGVLHSHQQPFSCSSTLSNMADKSESQTLINPYNLLGLVHNSDDTLTRLIPLSCTYEDDQAIIKDIPLNTAHKTWLRLFRPIEPPTNGDKLPIILYFHGGGFILCSAAHTTFHNFCTSLANKLSALIVSVEYRLAPESRLPAAYDDAVEAITWVRDQALDDLNGEQLLREFGDFSKCYLMGCSSGGNIVYHAGIYALDLDIEPVKIKGLILNQPFFGGNKRTDSELRMINDKVLPLAMSDMMWELALPRGVDRDHEYCNPMVHDDDKKIGIKCCFVSVRSGDPLMDHQTKFVRMLEKKGVCVVGWFDNDEEGYHGMELFEPQKAEVLFSALKDFVCSVGATE